MDESFRQSIIDRFEGFELVEYLQIRCEDVVDRFEDEILEADEDLKEFLAHGR